MWIDQFINKRKGVKYVMQLDRSDIDPDNLRMLDKHITGREYTIEYHMFEMSDVLPIIAQWRPLPGKGTGEIKSITMIKVESS
jgi:hypothetical protein